MYLYPPQVLCAGMGVGCDFLTYGLPVTNPSPYWPLFVLVGPPNPCICPHQPLSAPFMLAGLHWLPFVSADPAGSCSCCPHLLAFICTYHPLLPLIHVCTHSCWPTLICVLSLPLFVFTHSFSLIYAQSVVLVPAHPHLAFICACLGSPASCLSQYQILN